MAGNENDAEGPLPLKSALHKRQGRKKALKPKGPVLLPPAWGQLTLRLHIEYTRPDADCRLRVLLERAICTGCALLLIASLKVGKYASEDRF